MNAVVLSGLQKFGVRSFRGLKFSSGVVTFLISAIHLSRGKLVEGVDRAPYWAPRVTLSFEVVMSDGFDPSLKEE